MPKANLRCSGRLALRTELAATKRPFEVGLSGLIGQTRSVAGEIGCVSDTWAVALDLRAAFTDWVGCKGEAFTGQALGTYGGGISQSLNLFTGGPIRSSGGWGEVYLKPHPCLLWAAGYGIDNPLERDLGPFDRARNDYYFGAVFWDVTKALNVGAEVDYRKTAYIFPSNNNEALVYYFRVRLTFWPTTTEGACRHYRRVGRFEPVTETII